MPRCPEHISRSCIPITGTTNSLEGALNKLRFRPIIDPRTGEVYFVGAKYKKIRPVLSVSEMLGQLRKFGIAYIREKDLNDLFVAKQPSRYQRNI